MGKRKQIEYPHFDIGQKVKLLADVIRTPYIVGHGYGEPYVFVPAGEVGTITGGLRNGNYVVNFPQCGDIMRYALRLAPVEEGEADPDDTQPVELPIRA